MATLDSAYLRRNIINSDGITSWEQEKRHYWKLRKDAYLAEEVQGFDFYKLSSDSCHGYRRDWILKTTNMKPFIEPYYGLFLITINAEGEQVDCLLLAEKSKVLLETTVSQKMESRLYTDSTLAVTKIYFTCSDSMNGDETYCIQDSTVAKVQLTCQGSRVVSSQSFQKDIISHPPRIYRLAPDSGL